MDGNDLSQQAPSEHNPPSSLAIHKDQQVKQPSAATNEQLKAAEAQIDKRMSAFERTTLRLSTVAISVSVVVMLAIVFQAWEMYQGGIDTHALASAAKSADQSSEKNAKAAKSFAGSAQHINQGIADAVEKLGLQVEALRDNVKQTNGLAAATKSGILESRNAIRLENRAWLGVINEKMIQFEAGKPIKLDIFLDNSGRTPANNVRTAVSVTVDPRIVDFPMSFGDFVSTASVPPQGSHVIHVTSNKLLSGIQAAKIKDKSLLLVVRGTVDYEDFNGIARSTNICMYMADVATKEIVFCQTGNNMD